MQCIRDMEPSQRPRERLLEYGAKVLSDAELLAVLIRTGQRGMGAVAVAHALLVDAVRSRRSGASGLCGVGRRVRASALRKPPPCWPRSNSATVSQRRRCEPQNGSISRRSQASFSFGACRSRAARSSASSVSTPATTTLQSTNSASARGTTRRSMQVSSSGVPSSTGPRECLLFHNHPSGDLEPSKDDLDLTRRLVRGGQVVGVSVLDHLVVAGGRWLSLRSARGELFAGQ